MRFLHVFVISQCSTTAQMRGNIQVACKLSPHREHQAVQFWPSTMKLSPCVLHCSVLHSRVRSTVRVEFWAACLIKWPPFGSRCLWEGGGTTTCEAVDVQPTYKYNVQCTSTYNSVYVQSTYRLADAHGGTDLASWDSLTPLSGQLATGRLMSATWSRKFNPHLIHSMPINFLTPLGAQIRTSHHSHWIGQ